MAKRKKYKKRKQSNSNNTNMAIIVTIVISILLAVLICLESEAGTIGKGLSSFLGGMMGWLKYILPFGMIVIAINLACKKRGYSCGNFFRCGTQCGNRSCKAERKRRQEHRSSSPRHRRQIPLNTAF